MQADAGRVRDYWCRREVPNNGCRLQLSHLEIAPFTIVRRDEIMNFRLVSDRHRVHPFVGVLVDALAMATAASSVGL